MYLVGLAYVYLNELPNWKYYQIKWLSLTESQISPDAMRNLQKVSRKTIEI
jgi:hypothetical protein